MKGRRGALGQYHASMSNNRGHDFEEAIRQACLLYANQGRAKVELSLIHISEPTRP